MQGHQSACSLNISGMFGGGCMCFTAEYMLAQMSTW